MRSDIFEHDQAVIRDFVMWLCNKYNIHEPEEDGYTLCGDMKECSPDEILQEYFDEIQSIDKAAASVRWIIAISDSEGDGVQLQSYTGTEQDVVRLLLQLVAEDKAKDEEGFDYGTEEMDDVSVCNGELNAYAVFSGNHIDYTAKRIDLLPEVS